MCLKKKKKKKKKEKKKRERERERRVVCKLLFDELSQCRTQAETIEPSSSKINLTEDNHNKAGLTKQLSHVILENIREAAKKFFFLVA